MAKIDFPVAISDGQEFTASTGVVYTYVGTPPNGYWSAEVNTGGGGSEDYVEKTGDNMTGDLTLGTDKITLATDGSATYAAKVTSASTVAGDDGTTLTTKDYVDAAAADGGAWTQAGTVLHPTTATSVGIGTTTPDTTVQVNGSQAFLHLQSTDGTNPAGVQFTPGGQSQAYYIYADGSRNLLFEDHTTEHMRINSSGKLLLGALTSRSAGDVDAQMQVEGTNYASSSLNLISNAGASTGNVPHLTLAKSRGTVDGSADIVADGDNLGIVQFAGADGTDLNSVVATIIGRVDGTPGVDDMPGCLMFATTSPGASTPTERMRLDSSGVLKIGGTLPASPNIELRANGSGSFEGGLEARSPSPVGSVFAGYYSGGASPMQTSIIDANGNIQVGVGSKVNAADAAAFGLKIESRSNSGGIITQALPSAAATDFALVAYRGTTANVSILSNGSATFTGTVTANVVPPSDARFKENITPAKPQLADVVALGGILKNYDWTDEAPLNEELRSVRQLGLVAQEVEDICPSLVKDINQTKTMEITPAVIGPKGRVITEAVTEQVDDSYKGLSQEALIMKLIGAVAELSAEVTALKEAANNDS